MRMRKLLLVAIVSATALAAVPAVSAFAASSHDQLVGSGTLTGFGNPTTEVSANEVKSGLKGSFTITYPDGTAVSGTPTCLAVQGNGGYFIGKIDTSAGPRVDSNNWHPGDFVVIRVVDNGNPGQGSPDRLNFSPGYATSPQCAPNVGTDLIPISDGNFHVTDS